MELWAEGFRFAMLSRNTAIAAFSWTHFLIDFSCVFLMMTFVIPSVGSAGAAFGEGSISAVGAAIGEGSISAVGAAIGVGNISTSDATIGGMHLFVPDALLYTILYNFFAFAVQLPLGVVIDNMRRNALVAPVGCIMVAVALLLKDIPVAALVLCGLGNAAFHVGGAFRVIGMSRGRCGSLGIFIAPGAIGVFLGMFLSKNPLLVMTYIAAGVLVLFAFVLYRAGNIECDETDCGERIGVGGTGNVDCTKGVCVGDSGHMKSNESIAKGDINTPSGNARRVMVFVACGFFLVVVLRSCIGLGFAPEWKSETILAAILVCATALGKVAGGLVADRISPIRTVAISLPLSAVLFIFSFEYALAGILAIFLFNMTMAITLWGIVRVFRSSRGFAFGLLSFGLFIGAIPVLISTESLMDLPHASLFFAAGAALSCVLLIPALKTLGKR